MAEDYIFSELYQDGVLNIGILVFSRDRPDMQAVRIDSAIVEV